MSDAQYVQVMRLLRQASVALNAAMVVMEQGGLPVQVVSGDSPEATGGAPATSPAGAPVTPTGGGVSKCPKCGGTRIQQGLGGYKTCLNMECGNQWKGG